MTAQNAASDDQMSRLPAAEDIPAWAIEYACGALRCGLQVPDIERDLQAKGVDPQSAAAIVDHCWQVRLAKDQRTRRLRKAALWVSRLASLMVLIGYATVAASEKDWKTLGYLMIGGWISLTFIWIPDLLSRFYSRISLLHPPAFLPVPPVLVAVAGWIVLLLPLWGPLLVRLVMS